MSTINFWSNHNLCSILDQSDTMWPCFLYVSKLVVNLIMIEVKCLFNTLLCSGLANGPPLLELKMHLSFFLGRRTKATLDASHFAKAATDNLCILIYDNTKKLNDKVV